jgi:hypothetical protein
MKTHRAIEIFELHVSERTDLNDSSVIDEDVDPAKMLEGLLDRRLNLRRFEQIARDGQHLGAKASQIILRASELIGVARKKGDFCAAAAELARDFQSKSARAAANESDFIPKVESHSATFNV